MMAEADDGGAVVLLCSGGDSTRAVYHALTLAVGRVSVIMEDRVSRWQLLRGRLRRLSVLRIFGQLCFMFVAIPCLRRAARTRIQQLEKELNSTNAIPAEDLLCVRSVNSD